jgi:hypothetical protein
MRFLKPILAFVFAAVIIATSGAMASARGMARDASGEMVLCVGTGSVTVLMDADGQPLGVAHFCPDCALGALAVVASADATPRPMVAPSQIQFFTYVGTSASRVLLRSHARGPPFVWLSSSL